MKTTLLLAVLASGCALPTGDLEEGGEALAEIDLSKVFRIPWAFFPPQPGAHEATGELVVSTPFEMRFDGRHARYHQFEVGGEATLVRIRVKTFGTFTPAVALEYEARSVDRHWVHLDESGRWPSARMTAWALVDRELTTIDAAQGIYELTLVRNFRARLSLYLTTDEIQRKGEDAVPTEGRYELQLLNFEEAQPLCGALRVKDLDQNDITDELEGPAANLFDGNPESGVTMGIGASSAYMTVDVSTCQHPQDPAELFLLSASLRWAPETLWPKHFAYNAQVIGRDTHVSIEDYRVRTEPDGTFLATIPINEPLRSLEWAYWQTLPSIWDSLGFGPVIDMRDLEIQGIARLALVRYRALDLRDIPPWENGARRLEMF